MQSRTSNKFRTTYQRDISRCKTVALMTEIKPQQRSSSVPGGSDAPARTLRKDPKAARKIVEVFRDAMLDSRS